VRSRLRPVARVLAAVHVIADALTGTSDETTEQEANRAA